MSPTDHRRSDCLFDVSIWRRRVLGPILQRDVRKDIVVSQGLREGVCVCDEQDDSALIFINVDQHFTGLGTRGSVLIFIFKYKYRRITIRGRLLIKILPCRSLPCHLNFHYTSSLSNHRFEIILLCCILQFSSSLRYLGGEGCSMNFINVPVVLNVFGLSLPLCLCVSSYCSLYL
jgi:hypothetical protein